MHIRHLVVAVFVTAIVLALARTLTGPEVLSWIAIAAALSGWMGLGWLGVRGTRKALDRLRYADGLNARAKRMAVLLLLMFYSACSFLAVCVALFVFYSIAASLMMALA